MAAQTGKGSIVQMEKGKPKGKCRKWKLVVSLGRDARTGKYPQKARAFHGTYTQAQKALAEFVAEINGGEVVRRSEGKAPPDKPPHRRAEDAGDYPHRHGDGLPRVSVNATFTIFTNVFSPMVVFAVALTPRHAQRQGGTRQATQGHYAQRHPQGRVAHVRPREEGGRHRLNPCDIVGTSSRDTGEKKHLTGAVVQELIGKLDPAESMECAIALCITLGLRRGEAVGLSWEDVNFEDHAVTVRHSFDKFGNLKAPMTAPDVRILPMSACTEEALRRREAALIEEYGPNAPGVTRRRTRTASCACCRQGGSSRTSSLTAPTPTT